MSIRRTITPADHFTIVPNDWLRDESLSWKARGLLAYLMSHTTEWTTSVAALVRVGTDGKAAVLSGIQELEDAGYLVRAQSRTAYGHFGEVDYDLIDPASPLTDYPSTGNPATGNPATGNPTPKKTNPPEDQEPEEHLPRSKPRKPLPEDWQPSLDHRSRAAAYGVDADHEADMFRAHASANDRRQADWNGAFTTWLGKARERSGNTRRLTNAERGMAEAAAQRAQERASEEQGLLALLGGQK